MKITIEPDEGETIVFDDVVDYVMAGIIVDKKMIPQDFDAWSGNSRRMVEKAHTLHLKLQEVFLDDTRRRSADS